MSCVEHNLDLHCDDGTFTPDSAIYKYVKNYFDPACAKLGIRYPEPDDVVAKARAAGFVDVTVRKYPYPWGPWARKPELKRIGAVAACLMETGLEVSLGNVFADPGG